MLLGVGRTIENQIGLADIFVRADMAGVDGERLLVVLQRAIRIAGFARGVAHQVVGVGVPGILGNNLLEERQRALVVPGLDHRLGAREVGVDRLGGLGRRWIGAAAC